MASIRAYARRKFYDDLYPRERHLFGIQMKETARKVKALDSQGLDVLWLIAEDDLDAVDISVELVFFAGRRGVPIEMVDQTCEQLEREFYFALEKTPHLPHDCVRGFAPQPNIGGSYQVIKSSRSNPAT